MSKGKIIIAAKKQNLRGTMAKRKYLKLLLLFILFVAFCLGDIASATEWSKVLGNDYIGRIHQTSDGGYIANGDVMTFGAWLLKLDSNGNILWQNAYGSPDPPYDGIHEVQQTADGGVIIAGHTGPYSTEDAWVAKLDADGNIIWSKTYGGSNREGAYSIKKTIDGGYIVGGFTTSFGAGETDVWIFKLNANGNIAWQKTYGGLKSEDVNYIQQTTDGGYIVVCDTYSFGATGKLAWVLKLDSKGNVSWQKAFGDKYEGVIHIEQTTDGGYVLGGYTESFGAGTGEAFVMKLNAKGSILWQKSYGETASEGSGVTQTADGGYIFFGRTESFGAGLDDLWLLNLDTSGNVQWQKTYGGAVEDQITGFEQTDDGGYVMAGVSGEYPSRRAWILKVDSNGNVPICKNIVGTSNATVSNINMLVRVPSFSTSNTTVSPVVNNPLTTYDIPISEESACYPFPIPENPTGLLVKATSSSQTVLTWKDNSDNETGFKIERKLGACDSANSWSQIAVKGANVTTYTNTGLTPNTSYSYRVRAYNSDGNSAYSNCASTTTGVEGSPNSPANLNATSVSASQIKLTWTDNSTDETGFRIYRKKGAEPWGLLTTTAASAGSFGDASADYNTTTTAYSYYVRACKNALCSPNTNTTVVPYKPTNLTATAVSSSRINLTWTDKSGNETGFEVYRKSGDCSSPSDWSLIATKGANNTSHSNTGLTTGQTYSYKVRAYYKSPGSPYAYGYSSYSNCKSATTP